MVNISFSATKDQFLARRKHVTRRVWKNALRVKSGQVVTGVEKMQGLKRGEKVTPMGDIRIILLGCERLDDIITRPYRPVPRKITALYGVDPVPETTLEGFPDMTPEEFVEFFCRMHKSITGDTIITRVMFDYVDDPLCPR